MSDESEALLRVDHVKYRKAGDGKSPIGRLALFTDFIEWRDNASPEVFTCKFIRINGQRVSPPHKSKVQLQLILKNEDQATFVFLNPSASKEDLVKERDAVKEALQSALVKHRHRVNELAKSVESQSKQVELQAKQKILQEDRNLEKLYQNLVATKLITPDDFWSDYYQKEGVSEDKIGINGAFLANIVQQEGTNGVRLNLNPEIIQAIYSTYPAVQKKNLELVPHEMSEENFWKKFFQSHYFHREREVLPNPKDPFAECVRDDEEEMTKMTAEKIQRKRFDLEHIDDNGLRDFIHKSESQQKSAKTTLIKRCNYLSEKILATSWRSGEAAPTTSAAANQKKGFGVLDRLVAETETRLESEDLATKEAEDEVQIVRISSSAKASQAKYSKPDMTRYKALVTDYFQNSSVEDILHRNEMLLDQQEMETWEMEEAMETDNNEVPPPENWCQSAGDLAKVRDVHSAVREICRQFWKSFPPIDKASEEKLNRMAGTLSKYRDDIRNSDISKENLTHCIQMIDLAVDKFEAYEMKKMK
ncbi:BSD domain-containing protein [Caenorhabditis elegans]|uniref:BSD domain-containing protein n=2 Tax=Caenorhabditis elegans TaxID=6239 RepID=O44499_CAEEL|nr:BSD domain-containing protein [Caenorhabditis elegans]CCD73167.1 BSD domain-containing protein [Caenorhabditis elegans]|eukprot:NP_499880.3 General Transcription Factor homolog [Caenorhabditis elegans]